MGWTLKHHDKWQDDNKSTTYQKESSLAIVKGGTQPDSIIQLLHNGLPIRY